MTETLEKGHQECEALANWIYENLNGLQIPQLPTVKRVQLSAACWHLAIEHGMAIPLLIKEGLEGSAMALLRPALESYVRGLWLAHAATDAEVDTAGRDEFPRDFFGKIVNDLEKPGRFPPGLSSLRNTWKAMCSYTHTGFQQIGARLTITGLDSQYSEGELLYAFGASRAIMLLAAGSLASVAGNQSLMKEISERADQLPT